MWEALGGSVLSAGCGTSFSEEPLLGFGSGNILLVGCPDSRRVEYMPPSLVVRGMKGHLRCRSHGVNMDI